jgi:hypothetical protein
VYCVVSWPFKVYSGDDESGIMKSDLLFLFYFYNFPLVYNACVKLDAIDDLCRRLNPSHCFPLSFLIASFLSLTDPSVITMMIAFW